MKFGIFSNSARLTQSPTDDYQSDLEEIVLGDELGLSEVWISEHIGSEFRGAVTVPDLLIAKAAALTSTIRLGAAVRLLPLFHPLDVATQAAVNDHLTNGRYNLGVGSGFPNAATFGARGLAIEERIPRTLEAFEFIMKCFTSDGPFDFDGDFYSAKQVSLLPKAVQQPHPPVSIASSSDMLRLAGESGHGLLLGHFDSTDATRKRIGDYVSIAEQAGITNAREGIRVARLMFLAEDAKVARRAMKTMVEGDLEVRRRWAAKESTAPNPYKSLATADETIDDMNFDLLEERGAFLVGDPDDVVGQLNRLSDEVGGFGTLLYVGGKTIGTPEEARASLTLFANEVAPRVEAHARSRILSIAGQS